jgi:hypothetical protein
MREKRQEGLLGKSVRAENLEVCRYLGFELLLNCFLQFFLLRKIDNGIISMVTVPAAYLYLSGIHADREYYYRTVVKAESACLWNGWAVAADSCQIQ